MVAEAILAHLNQRSHAVMAQHSLVCFAGLLTSILTLQQLSPPDLLVLFNLLPADRVAERLLFLGDVLHNCYYTNQIKAGKLIFPQYYKPIKHLIIMLLPPIRNFLHY